MHRIHALINFISLENQKNVLNTIIKRKKETNDKRDIMKVE